MGPLGELGALFNPGMRHELEERRSRALRREEEGNARDGDVRIDLDSGVAVINAPARSDAGADSAADDTDADLPPVGSPDPHGVAAETDVDHEGVGDSATPPEPSASGAADVRSAARPRRGRPTTKNRRTGR